MAKAKHNYSSDEFYDNIAAYAMQGFTDAEIADALNLNPDVFGKMKNGNYDKWSKEQNKRNSERIGRVLAHGRTKINAIVRSVYLKAALGGKKLKNKSVTTRHLRDSNGKLTDEEDVQTTVSEIEQAPNIQALATWMFHHDNDWRKIERNQDDDNRIPSPEDIDQGIDIDSWIKDQVNDGRKD
jgi:hypothetical protein